MSDREPVVCLIVDDDEGIRSLLEAILEGEGYRCRTAIDTRAAEQVMAAEPVSVMLLDLSVLNGDELDYLHDLGGRRPDLAVLIVTGRRDPAHAAQAVAAGAAGYLNKPFQAAQLRDAVREALAARDSA
jgi:DNA-binding NtrC family response regulator